jgi:hypothetical protein
VRTGESYVEIMGFERGVIVDGDGQFFAQSSTSSRSHRARPIQFVTELSEKISADELCSAELKRFRIRYLTRV